MKSLRLLLAALFLGACSIDVSGPTPVTVRPTGSQPSPVAASPQPGATPAPVALTPVPAPLPWAGRNLGGKLVFLTFVNAPQSAPILVQLDLATGAQTALFEPPTNTWISGAAVSPDRAHIVVAYAPPPPPDDYQYGYTELYLLPADGSAAPQPLLTRTEKVESFFNPAWSPDGDYLYYVHLLPDAVTDGAYQYRLERMAYPDGQPEVVSDHAMWPRPSPDGTKLAFVAFDPPNGMNDLYLADPDGKNAQPLMPRGAFQSVDAPFFSPEGGLIYFSATGEGPALVADPHPGAAQPGEWAWLDRLLGVQTAHANGAPSDWWRISVAGGQPQRLTRILESGLYGAFSPDGGHIAFITLNGLYVMNADGSALTPLLRIANVGTLDWIP
jgi:Tol biopolymer transport system component